MRYVNLTAFIVLAALLLLLPPHARGQQGAAGAAAAPRPAAASPAAAPPKPAAAPSAGTSTGSVRLPETVRDAPPPREAAPPEASKQSEAAGKAESMPVPGGDEMVYLNVQDQDIADVIRQISKATSKNFIIDDKVRGKVTIMSEKMMTKEEAYQAFLSALEVAGFTTVIGPGGIIKVVSLKDAVSSPIPIHVDSTPYTDSYVTRLIPLKNISALDMSNAIKGLISKSGNMFAYPATNTLIITDSGTNIDRLMKIIKELDQEGPQQVLEIIPINYADAKELAQTVLSLFELEAKGGAQAAAGAKRAPGAAEMSDIKDVSKIIADERTNSLIVLASKRAIDQVRDIIAKLDSPLEMADTGTVHVHYLKYANAKDLAATLSAITSGKGPAPAAPKPAAAGGKEGAAAQAPTVAQLEGGVSIGADETTNALIITASAKDYKTLVDELIAKLDIPRRQVYLEAIIMELEVEKKGQQGATGYGGLASSSLMGFAGTNLGDMSAVKGVFDPTSFFSMPGLLGGLLSRSTVSIDIPSTSGTSTTVNLPAFAAFLNFLQTYRDFNIVSMPNILTLDNQKASIEVTRIQYAKKVSQGGTTGFLQTEPIEMPAGLTLEITPQISEGDAVRMEIHQKLENFVGEPDPATGAAPKTKREITTAVMALNGQTVVLGGLMEDKTTHTKAKVPLLGDIPLLGFLFRNNSSSTTKSNLLVFVTPHVIKDPSDFGDVTKMKIEQRNTFIESNFGKRQQKSIYETIAAHRADLLAYSPQLNSNPRGIGAEITPAASGPSSSAAPMPYQPPAPAPLPTPTSAPMPATPSSTSYAPPAASSGGAVITVPPVGTGGKEMAAQSAVRPEPAPEKSAAKPKAKKAAPAPSPSAPPTPSSGTSPTTTKPAESGNIDLSY